MFRVEVKRGSTDNPESKLKVQYRNSGQIFAFRAGVITPDRFYLALRVLSRGFTKA